MWVVECEECVCVYDEGVSMKLYFKLFWSLSCISACVSQLSAPDWVCVCSLTVVVFMTICVCFHVCVCMARYGYIGVCESIFFGVCVWVNVPLHLCIYVLLYLRVAAHISVRLQYKLKLMCVCIHISVCMCVCMLLSECHRGACVDLPLYLRTWACMFTSRSCVCRVLWCLYLSEDQLVSEDILFSPHFYKGLFEGSCSAQAHTKLRFYLPSFSNTSSNTLQTDFSMQFCFTVLSGFPVQWVIICNISGVLSFSLSPNKVEAVW